MPLDKFSDAFRDFSTIFSKAILLRSLLSKPKCLASSINSAECNKDFVGIHPQFKQTPPRRSSSKRATFIPS